MNAIKIMLLIGTMVLALLSLNGCFVFT